MRQGIVQWVLACGLGIALVGCGSGEASVEPPAPTMLVPTAGPEEALPPLPSARATATPTPDPHRIPEPPIEPVPPGQDARVGAWTVRLHAVRRGTINADPWTGQAARSVIALDISARNETAAIQPWMALPTSQIYALLAADGQYLALAHETNPALVPELLPPVDANDPCAAPMAAQTALQSMETGGGGMAVPIPPGGVFRAWVAFLVADAEAPAMLQLRVPAGKGADFRASVYRARFLLHGASRSAALPWTPPAGAREPGGPVAWGAFRLWPPREQPRPPVSTQDDPVMACSWMRALTVQAENTGKESARAPGMVWLVDADGRHYRRLAGTPVLLDPGYTDQLTYTFLVPWRERRTLGILIASDMGTDAVMLPTHPAAGTGVPADGRSP